MLDRKYIYHKRFHILFIIALKLSFVKKLMQGNEYNQTDTFIESQIHINVFAWENLLPENMFTMCDFPANRFED